MIHFLMTDGGRAVAGYKGVSGDCVCRAIAIVSGQQYQDVYDSLNHLATSERKTAGKTRSSARDGVHKATYRKLLAEWGYTWTPTMFVGSGCTVHLRPDELPEGRLLVEVSKHVTVVINGVLHDTYDCSRNGTRCVYGYWTAPSDTLEDEWHETVFKRVLR